jgi:hypothetical protein
MRAQTIGRVLGTGLRVAGRMAGQRLAQQAAARPVTVAGVGGAGVGGPGTSRTTAHQAVISKAKVGAKVGSGVARGVGGFLRPFGRVGGKIFQEVTGVFFLLFVLVFGNWAWRTRGDYAQGPEHVKFLVYAGLMLVFLYLSASSFWRARRK